MKLYDFEKIRKGEHLKVRDIIEEFKNLPQEADFCICGSDTFYVHVSTDDSVVCLDTELLQDAYYDENNNGHFGDVNDIQKIVPIIFDNN